MSQIVIVAIAKNENAFVEEWLDYHLAVGFDTVYLYDNGGEDDESLDFISSKYQTNLVLTKLAGPGRQSAAYRHFLQNFKQRCEWAAFIDLDEFIMFRRHANVQGFLAQFGSIPTIALNWKMFGHSIHKVRPDGAVLQNYVWRYPFIFPQIKSLCRCSDLEEILSIHNIDGRARLVNGLSLNGLDKLPIEEELVWQRSSYDTSDIVVINHYFSRSLEDIEKKLARGSAAGTLNRSYDWYLSNTRVFNSVLDVTAAHAIKQLGLVNNALEPTMRHVLPGDFDLNWYTSFYPDLSRLSKDEAEAHFISIGALENRAWCKAEWEERYFDAQSYMEMNEDVREYCQDDLAAATQHYFVRGRYENRSWRQINS